MLLLIASLLFAFTFHLPWWVVGILLIAFVADLLWIGGRHPEPMSFDDDH